MSARVQRREHEALKSRVLALEKAQVAKVKVEKKAPED